MKPLPEDQLAAYIQEYLKRHPQTKKAISRHFSGTVQTVAPVGALAYGPPFLVTITKPEGPDASSYMCAIPGYYPIIGDLVECEWRDANVGFVKYPISYQLGVPFPYTCRVWQNVLQSIPNNAWTTLTNLATDYDYDSDFIAPTYTVPVSGRYEISVHGALAAAAATTTRVGIRVFKNGVTIVLNDLRSPVSVGVQTVTPNVRDTIALLAGDTLVLQMYQDSGGPINTITPDQYAGCWMTIRYDGL